MVDPVGEVDQHLSGLLKRPAMFAGTLETLEALVWQALYFRSVFANTAFDLRQVAARLLIEMTGKSSGAAPYYQRLLEFYGDTSYSSREHPRHEDVIGFYRRLVSECQALPQIPA
jgi:hypothetical protein